MHAEAGSTASVCVDLVSKYCGVAPILFRKSAELQAGTVGFEKIRGVRNSWVLYSSKIRVSPGVEDSLLHSPGHTLCFFIQQECCTHELPFFIFGLRGEMPMRYGTRPMLIDGQWRAGAKGETFPTINPANREVLAEVARGTEADIDEAVDAARRALQSPAWDRMVPAARGRLLQHLAALIRRQSTELAEMETLDCGKPLSQARADVETTAQYFDYCAGAADKIFGTTIPLGPQYLDYTVREPLGVTAHITPWNFPLAIAARGIAPALAAGNTVVLKPAEQTPLTALRLGELALQAGLPPGVFNVVPGFGADAGAHLAGHPQIQHLTFTGSVDTGVSVMQAAARNVVPVTLELGGKSPNIVFADARLEDAVTGALRAIFANAGQVCSAGSRLLVQR